MIYSDNQIEKAIRDGLILIDPPPDASQFDSSSLNLRVGDDFHVWKASLSAPGSAHVLDLDAVDLSQIIDLTDRLEPQADGSVIIPPGKLVLVRTLEHLSLPLESKLAARVEGRSKQARLGMAAHLTAPTIHAGFAGRITLEIVVHGPFHLRVWPNESRLCQLVIEEVGKVPTRSGSRQFSHQATPLGTPPKRRKPR